ncbi:MAG: hypothetical protein LGR52_11990, partial [Candidatus Thiosymbion ectosymbiont of Robbea hypermnestra]|nr:hypothetical protein [Candidatus Thiosymbion ectosymbiont of Robbea hypermnestra]
DFEPQRRKGREGEQGLSPQAALSTARIEPFSFRSKHGANVSGASCFPGNPLRPLRLCGSKTTCSHYV